MNIFANAATAAVNLMYTNPPLSPEDAWIQALKSLGAKQSVIEKGCPKNAFIGLCESGQIKSIPAALNIKGGLNADYALDALLHLQTLSKQPATIEHSELWAHVMSLENRDIDKKHNQQMHVVLGLWNSGLIV